MGDSTYLGSQPATHTRLSIFLQNGVTLINIQCKWEERKQNYKGNQLFKNPNKTLSIRNFELIAISRAFEKISTCSPALRDVPNPELCFIPRHIRVTPFNPCQSLTLGIQAWKCIEIIATHENFRFWITNIRKNTCECQ